MLFQIKSKPKDFVVEEILWKWIPSWKWDFIYVFFEKENLTTMDIVDDLTKNFHLQRDEIGIAWLKDKAWITRQWISISQRSLSKIWWEESFIQTLWKKVKILEKSYNESWLKVASNQWNKFGIRLRARQNISKEIKNQIENNVEKIIEKWFPNCFWMQRFGKWKKNFYEAKDRLKELAKEYNEKWKLKEADLPYHLRFLLQAYPSMYFNEYVLNRWEKWLFLLQWDILVDKFNSNWVKTVVYDSQNVYEFDYRKLKKEKSDLNFFEPEPHPTPLLIGEGIPTSREGEVNAQDFYPVGGASAKASEWQFDVEQYDENKRFSTWPMLWWNLLLPAEWTKARVRDNQLLQLAEFDEWMQQVCKIYNLWWVRRVLFIKVSDLKFEWDNDDIKLQFFLPTGSYATTLVSFILQWIDHLTLKDNSLLIPRISNK
jgi:tRNA(Glu) U13 pseudouridine synthase TruD